MDIKKPILSLGAVVILVFIVLFAIAAIFIVLLTPVSGAEEPAIATSVPTVGSSKTMPADGYGIRILFSDGEIVSVGGIVQIKPGQVPKRIIFVPVKMTPSFVFQIEKQ